MIVFVVETLGGWQLLLITKIALKRMMLIILKRIMLIILKRIMLIILIVLIMPLPGVSQRGLGGHPCRGVKLEQRRDELLRHFAELGHLSRRI